MPISDLLAGAFRRAGADAYPPWVAYEPQLVPPPSLMRTEGITVLEEWYRWGEEWSVLLRVYGLLATESRVLEIGCGLGRIAFPLRYILSERGAYLGFEIVRQKVDFLARNFAPAHPHFRFEHADVRNTYYNPGGTLSPSAYRFPVEDASQDLVFAASVFTHMLPDHAKRYFAESARVLRPGGRCVFSFFLLDHYERGRSRPHGFARSDFDFDHAVAPYGSEFATVVPDDPEQMTAYRMSLIRRMAEAGGLRVHGEPVPGLWSGSAQHWVGAQDLVILSRE